MSSIKIKKINFPGVHIIEHRHSGDKRGFLNRIFDIKLFKTKKFAFSPKVMNYSFNKKKGTFRGFHYQSSPFQDKKIVSCVSGKVLDICVYIKKNRTEPYNLFKIELSWNDNISLLLSGNIAHGFQTLKNNSSLIYLHDQHYYRNYDKNIKLTDKKINIKLPLKITNIAKKDF